MSAGFRLLDADRVGFQVAWESRPDFVAPITAQEFQRLPERFRASIRQRYITLRNRQGDYAANVWLRESVTAPVAAIGFGGYVRSRDDEAIRHEADTRAHAMRRLLVDVTPDTYGRAAKLAEWHKVTPPQPGRAGRTLEGAARRLCDALWWRRQIRSRDGRVIETLARTLNLVNQQVRECYASAEAVERRRSQKTRNRAILGTLQAESSTGDVLPLLQIVEHSVSTPAIRRAELMTRIHGMEDWATEQGMQSEFVTATCPSAYHRAHAKSGREVSNWNGTTPREAQAYLAKCWARVRAAWQRAGIDGCGLRIAEPHHDGTPHWHLLIFWPEGQAEAGFEILAREFERADHYEVKPGVRVKRIPIDRERGSAAGYVAKYVCKNIDGAHIEKDLLGNPAVDTAERVDAWASVWGIRQFQFFGTAPVGVWRELRRLDAGQAGAIEPARECADAGNYHGYLRHMRAAPITLYKAEPDGVTPLGEWRGFNRYGEALHQIIIGVTDGLYWACSRIKTWLISFSSSVASATAWTRVNNCTEENAL
ncbi:MAG TPA: replication endonuclease [Gammaproteobacteria bacterium]|nr:replication endonuclease [Gammaproteobacteria bacterium]